MSLNVLLVAEESAGIQVLRALAKSPYQVAAVMASPAKAAAGVASVWKTAQQFGYETWPAKLVKGPAPSDRIRSQGVDLLLNVHPLYIIHAEVLGARVTLRRGGSTPAASPDPVAGRLRHGK